VTPSAEDTAGDVERAQAQLDAAKAAHAAAQEDAPPRDPPVVLAAILDLLSMRFGHHPEFTKLIAEYKAGALPKDE
jgi:hypothetical protein